MSIKITFISGSTASFTDVVGYSNDGKVVQFSGVDESGVMAGWEFNWSEILKVQKNTQ